jgi:hypothetical protein
MKSLAVRPGSTLFFLPYQYFFEKKGKKREKKGKKKEKKK